MAQSSVKKLIIQALTELHRRSTAPKEEQWFTRGDIARHLSAPSLRLNPARVNALKELVDEGKVAMRQRPNDARIWPQYQLVEG